MLSFEQDRLRNRIHELAEEYGRNRAAVLPILGRLQAEQGHVSGFSMQEMARALGLHAEEIYGVVTFYHFMDTEPRGRFLLRLCRTISCDMAGKEKVARQLCTDLGIQFGQTTADGMFTLEWINCMGMCDQGPALLVNNQVFTNVTADKVAMIVEDCRRSLREPGRPEKREWLK